ncbi:hypothetical protein [Caproiciproducens sp.]
MTDKMKKNYDRYINQAMEHITKCKEWDLVPYDIEKILKKQGNKRLLEKIGELAEQIDLQYAKDDERIEKTVHK